MILFAVLYHISPILHISIPAVQLRKPPQTDMPALAKDVQKYHISLIRSLISEDHQITFEEVVEQLEKRCGITLHRSYVTRLAKKIYNERATRADRQTLNVALASFEDTMNVVVKKAW